MRIPVISLPLKEGQELDFTEALSNYISTVYDQDPSNYHQDIRELNETRSKITNQELNDQQQRESIIKYYFLLESVEKRFQFDEKHCKVEFSWKDSFCGARISQNSVAFEKACILFNLAVLSSRLGSMQDRFELSGLKLAFNYFQSASGLFKHIRHTFINPPSQDLQPEFVVFLEELMLTQAQELLVEKSRDENKSDQLVARLANYCHESYQKLSSDLESDIFQEEFKNHKKIFSLVKCKALYYSAMANYHQALVSVSSNMYSEIISFLGIALADCKECVRAAKEFGSISTSFWQQFELKAKNDEQDRPEARLMLLAENLLAAIASTHAQASKDNDLIYNAEIVPRQRLKIDKVLAVKAISFKEILVASQHPVGENFKTLISMKTHLTASRYSVKKDSILRLLKEEISQSDQILTVTLSSLNIQKFLSNFQQALENSKYVPNLPEVLIQAIKNCNEHEKNGETGAKMDSLISMIRVINHEIQRLVRQLKEEEIHSEENRARLLDKWSATSSSKASATLQKAIAQIILEVNQIDAKIKELKAKMNDISPLIAMWKNPLDTIHQQFQQECVPTIAVNFGEEIPQIEGLDLITKIQDIVKRLQHVKKERGTILQEMQSLVLYVETGQK